MRQRLLKTIAALTLAAAMLLGDLLPVSASSVAAPSASKKSGTIQCAANSTSVKLTADGSATIYYSLNDDSYKKYSSAIKLTKNSTLKTYAVKNGKESSVATYNYKLKPNVSFSVSGSGSKKTVQLSSGTNGVKLYYTTDGSKPTTSSKRYSSSGITITKSCKLRVLAVKSGWSNASFSKKYTVKGSAGDKTSKETYTSPKTGTVLTIPEKGRASVVLNGIEKTMPAKNDTYSLNTSSVKYNNRFYVYLDGQTTESNLYVNYYLAEEGDWKAGKSYSFEELKKHYANEITVKGFYRTDNNDYDYSWALFGNIFKDAQFTIIERDSSTGEMKWYFYIKMSYSNTTNIVEGVAHTVLDEKTTPTSDSYLENGGGSTGGSTGGGGTSGGICFTCGGTGNCQRCYGRNICPACSGRGGQSYNTWGQGGSGWVNCTACNGHRTCPYCSHGECRTCGGSGRR